MTTAHCRLANTIFICLFFAISAATSFGADVLLPPTATTLHDPPFEVTTVARVNGCQFVLKQSTNSSPALKGYWIQDVYIFDHRLISITNITAFGERTLKIENDANFSVLQVDRNTDGIYETFLVYSAQKQKLADVLILTQFGWLRHGTPSEFQAGEAALSHLRGPVEEIRKQDDKAIREVWDNMKGAITKPR